MNGQFLAYKGSQIISWLGQFYGWFMTKFADTGAILTTNKVNFHGKIYINRHLQNKLLSPLQWLLYFYHRRIRYGPEGLSFPLSRKLLLNILVESWFSQKSFEWIPWYCLGNKKIQALFNWSIIPLSMLIVSLWNLISPLRQPYLIHNRQCLECWFLKLKAIDFDIANSCSLEIPICMNIATY